MGNNSTSRERRGFAPSLLLAALTAACTTGTEPDPSEVRRDLALRAQPWSLIDDSPVAVTVDLMGMAASPAPMTESLNRQSLTVRERMLVAVGRNASPCVDPAVQHGFAAACADLEGSFAVCPDRDAVEQMLLGRVDLALLGGSLSAREQHAGLRQTRLGVELFALAVAVDFPARSLTRTQVRQVLTGEISDWQQVGYDAGPVLAVVPADRGLAERAAHTLILGDDFGAGAMRVANERLVADQILRNRGTIGVVRVTSGGSLLGLKLLQIDWTPPTPEAYGYGTYPYGVPVHMVTSGQPSSVALRFLQFAQSEDGRELLGRTLALQ